MHGLGQTDPSILENEIRKKQGFVIRRKKNKNEMTRDKITKYGITDNAKYFYRLESRGLLIPKSFQSHINIESKEINGFSPLEHIYFSMRTIMVGM